ncbi:hypothetical protein GCM10010193_57270 [Kitasatospora atroaurantiaca]|uniref:Uncharacterized protein n=1 Tax=Kitasatospora atroaurantiaca TaxID=285545 RepID=A0A561EMX9_9ACTN|nr:DUF6093 family protein [Kitasatospora atroaurantiaca]TWE16975.1 hypothetical protein FB465_1970 [Kitasatospora atroaurantiaca]
MSTPTDTSAQSGILPNSVIALVERKLLTDTVRIFRPGPMVLDPTTGQYVPGPDVIVYEGPGAHRPASGPGIVLRLEGQPYRDDGDARYTLFTPLSAPVAAIGDRVTVVHSEDTAAVGRVWRVLDPGETATVEVVRATWMRIDKAGGTA